jgi:hypothetical protein
MVFSVSLPGQQDSILMLTEEEIECAIKPVEIRNFKDNTERVKFQIVAGRPIGYSAAKGDDTSPFIWHLFKDQSAHGFEYVYTLEGINPTTMAKSGTAKIAASTLNQFNSNQYFGPATVQVDNGTGGMADIAISIFYEKEAIHPVSGNPNWFDYWQDNVIIKDLLESVPKIREFNLSTCEFEEKQGHNPITFTYDALLTYNEDYSIGIIEGTYGSHSFYPPKVEVGEGSANSFCTHLSTTPYLVSHQPVDIIIKLGPGASRKKPSWERDGTILEGIHVFYSTLVHELEHAQIKYDNWKDGYDKSKDVDDDEYHDGWEIMANQEMVQSTFNPKPYGEFTTTPKIDAYHSYHPDDLFQDPPRVSAGTDYEEWRCLKKEYYLYSELNSINSFDWSYDPPVGNSNDPRLRTKGKQW